MMPINAGYLKQEISSKFTMNKTTVDWGYNNTSLFDI